MAVRVRKSIKPRLIAAVESGDNQKLLDSLKEKEFPQNDLDKAVHVAAAQGKEVAARMLMASGADPKSLNVHDETLLLQAVNNGNVATVKVLFEEGYDVNYKVGNAAETGTCVPLHMAIMKDNTKLAQLLIQEGAFVNTLDMDGDTPLIAACNEQNLEVLQALIGKNADVNLGGYEGNTALHRAAQTGSEAIIKALIAGKANIAAENDMGVTPLMEACLNGSKDVVELIMAAGADAKHKDKGGKNAFHMAATGGEKDLIDVLVKAGVDHNAVDLKGNTPMIYGAWMGQAAFCNEMLAKLPDVDILKQGEGKRTALHWAVATKLHDLMTKLMEKDQACVEMKDANGKTAMSLLNQ